MDNPTLQSAQPRGYWYWKPGAVTAEWIELDSPDKVSDQEILELRRSLEELRKLAIVWKTYAKAYEWAAKKPWV